MKESCSARVIFVVMTCLAPIVHGAEQKQQTKLDLGTVEVVGVSPLAGSDVPIDEIPSNVQTAGSEDLEKTHTISLANYMRRYMGSVSVNEAQSNPLQPNIFYRGFVGSPLLGMPQGLSMYVDGVRFNEPFGNTINWGLISNGAIQSMALYPSNPVYGLNSLGGAIAVTTKTGFSAPRHQLEAYGGSWGRQSEELTSGGNNGRWGYFVDLHHFAEHGWRQYSPTRANQGFGTLSWRGDKGSLDLKLAANDNVMTGNGAAPVQLLQQQRNAIFTVPDITITKLFFTELKGGYDWSDDIKFNGNAYFRQNRINTVNGNGTDYSPCTLPANAGLMCEGTGSGEQIVTNVNGHAIAAGPAVEGATENITQTAEYGRGGSFQTTFGQDLFKHRNNLVVGVSYDYAEVHFNSDTALGTLSSDRATIGSGIYVDDARVRLHTDSSSFGAYFSDNYSVTDRLKVTLSGRYNYIHINMDDRHGSSLNGSHTFARFNPAAGWTYRLFDNLTVYGNYSESNRAPSPMELSCADPNAPCTLPNAMVSDPPLKQVVAKTYEGGFRGNLDDFLDRGELRWNAGYFHSINYDAIIFHYDPRLLNKGYFSNVGKTRRYGVEAGLTVNYPQLFSTIDDWHFTAHYTHLKAQYLSNFDELDPLGGNQLQSVKSGDRIPGIPEDIFNAFLSVDLWRRLSVGMNLIYSGARFFMGDQANTQPQLAGYWLLNGTAEFKVNDYMTVFGMANNLLDTRYNTFGVYSDATSVLGNAYDNRRFVSPGMPRSGWVGIRLTL